MTASEKNFAEDRSTRESDAHAHSERIHVSVPFHSSDPHIEGEQKQAAEEKYSREVIAHAEAMKTIDDLKRRIHDLQLSDRNNRTAAETAQAKLSTSEGSWSQQRQTLTARLPISPRGAKR
jgi:nucleoprotein TPR